MSDNPFDKVTTPDLPFKDPDTVALADLVKDDGKYKTQDDVAKALAHSQNHITSLTKTQEELRAELNKRLTLEEAVAKVTEVKSATPPQEPPVDPNKGLGTPPTPPEVKPEDSEQSTLTLEDIDKYLKEKETETAKSKNLTTVVNTLNSVTGSTDKTREFLSQKATSLGIPVERLQDIGSDNPAILFKLLDVNTQNPGTSELKKFATPVIKAAPNLDNPTTLEDFAAIRKADPARYMSNKVQRQLMKLALKDN